MLGGVLRGFRAGDWGLGKGGWIVGVWDFGIVGFSLGYVETASFG